MAGVGAGMAGGAPPTGAPGSRPWGPGARGGVVSGEGWGLAFNGAPPAGAATAGVPDGVAGTRTALVPDGLPGALVTGTGRPFGTSETGGLARGIAGAGSDVGIGRGVGMPVRPCMALAVAMAWALAFVFFASAVPEPQPPPQPPEAPCPPPHMLPQLPLAPQPPLPQPDVFPAGPRDTRALTAWTSRAAPIC